MGRPDTPKISTHFRAILFQREPAHLGMKPPLIPKDLHLTQPQLRIVWSRPITGRQRHQTGYSMRRKNGHRLRSPTTPILANQPESVDPERIGEIKNILRQKRS